MQNKSPVKISLLPVILIFILLYCLLISIGLLVSYKLFPIFVSRELIKISRELSQEDPVNAEVYSLLTGTSFEFQTQLVQFFQENEGKNSQEMINEIKNLEKYAESKQEKFIVNAALAKAYIQLKDIENAQKATDTILLVGPEYSIGYLYQASLDLQNKEFEKAVENAQKAIAINPNFSESYYLLSIGYFQTRKPKEALEQINKALELSPDNTSYAKLRDSLIVSPTPSITPITVQKTQSSRKLVLPVPKTSDLHIFQMTPAQWKTEADRLRKVSASAVYINHTEEEKALMIDLFNKMISIADKLGQKPNITTEDQTDVTNFYIYNYQQQYLIRQVSGL